MSGATNQNSVSPTVTCALAVAQKRRIKHKKTATRFDFVKRRNTFGKPNEEIKGIELFISFE
jgi:hypothetical protein